MIVVCQHCQSKFKVADDAIGMNGRAVRCSDCNHQWIEMPLQASSAYNNDIVPQPLIQPSIPFYESYKVRWLAYIISIFSLLVLLAGLFIINYNVVISGLKPFPFMEGIEKIFNSNGLKLEAVDCKINQNSPSSSIGLTTKVIVRNSTESNKTLNFIRFTIFDSKKNDIGNLVINLEQNLEPNETETIEGKFDSLPAEATLAVIEVGNFIDLQLRDVSNIILNSETK